MTTEKSAHHQEIGRLGAAKKYENVRRMQEAHDQLRAERPVLVAEITRLRAQKMALIAYAKGRGANDTEITDLLAPSLEEVN